MNLDDALRDQAALYALDALPEDEAAKFRQIVRTHPELADLVAEYEATSSLLAETAPAAEPPAALRGRVLAAIGGEARPLAPETSHRAAIWVPWGIAAALAVAAVTLWTQNARLTDQNRTLAREVAVSAGLEKDLAAARLRDASHERAAATLRARITELEKRSTLAETQVATLTSKLDASYLASIAWDASSQEGILKVRRLPATQPGKDYELWVIDPHHSVPVSAGVFTVQPDGSANIQFSPAQRVTEAKVFAVSVEAEGGSLSPRGPQGDIILMSN